MKIEFTSEEHIQRLNHVGFGDDGDFYADFLLIDGDAGKVTDFVAFGIWRTYDGHVSSETYARLNVKLLDLVPIAEATAGRLFQTGWAGFEIEEMNIE